jgi:hypothetical protein
MTNCLPKKSATFREVRFSGNPVFDRPINLELATFLPESNHMDKPKSKERIVAPGCPSDRRGRLIRFWVAGGRNAGRRYTAIRCIRANCGTPVRHAQSYPVNAGILLSWVSRGDDCLVLGGGLRVPILSSRANGCLAGRSRWSV